MRRPVALIVVAALGLGALLAASSHMGHLPACGNLSSVRVSVSGEWECTTGGVAASGSVVHDFPLVVAAGCNDTSSVSTTGAAIGDVCDAAWSGTIAATSTITCLVTAANTAVVRHCCLLGCDPPSQTFTVLVRRP